MKLSIGLLAVAAAGLASCATSSGQTTSLSAGPVTPEQRTAAVAFVKSTFFDPYSVRDAQIATTTRRDPIIVKGDSVVCIRANAKNRMGAYVGQQTTVIGIANGKATGSLDNVNSAYWCGSVNWEPFKEIEAKP